jgi:hypothetical protein
VYVAAVMGLGLIFPGRSTLKEASRSAGQATTFCEYRTDEQGIMNIEGVNFFVFIQLSMFDIQQSCGQQGGCLYL